jgi:GTP1/Obg family GTP-binding protein
MNIATSIVEIERQYTTLLAEFPELADDEELRADVLEGETDLHSVLGRLVNGVEWAKCIVEAIEARRKELAERVDRYERRTKAYRAMIERVMTVTDTAKVVLPEATLSIRDAAPKLQEIDAGQTPEFYMRVKREPNKAAISEAIKAGDTVPGWTLSNGGKTLTIRSK